MQQYLPADILAITDLSTINLQKERYVDERLSAKITDILYRAKIKAREGYLYMLTEHQSTADKMMAFRLLDYTCQIMRHHVEDLGNSELPVVVPLVFYHGKEKYSDVKAAKRLLSEGVDPELVSRATGLSVETFDLHQGEKV